MSERVDTGLIAGSYEWTGFDMKATLPKSADKMRHILAIVREG